MKHFAVCILSLIIFFNCALIASAKPAPPTELTKILEPLAELEESYEEENWSEANEITGEITLAISSVIDQHSNEFPVTYKNRLNALTTKLSQSIKTNDEDDIEKKYIELQMFVFSIMDKFDYKIHPIITTLETYIVDEAREALEENDFDDIISEMREAGAFFSRTSKVLMNHGIKRESIKAFHTSIESAISQAEESNKQELETTLTNLQDLINVFQKSFI